MWTDARRAIHQTVVWIWAKQEQITFLATLFLVVLGLIGIASVVYTARAVRLQYKQYEEEAFNREQGAVSLAWRTLADANQNPSEIGQSTAIKFLIRKSQLDGKITLNSSSLTITSFPDDSLAVHLHQSNLCGSSIFSYLLKDDSISFNFSLLRGARFTGRLLNASFFSSDLQATIFSNVRAPNAIFWAANLKNTFLVGGSFEGADFQGATFNGLKTFRGHVGAGTKYDDSDVYLGTGWYTYADEYQPVLFGSPSDDISTWTSESDFTGDNIFLVDFRGARFLGSDIRGADLSNSTITQAQVDQACVDETTRLPSGVSVRQSCTEPDWISKRRNLLQQKTYLNRSKALQLCDAAAAEPSWR